MSKKKQPGVHYKVGYGKPPKETQFKPGQSGNCKGRPKGATNKVTNNSLYALVDHEASRIVSVMNGDQKITMSMANLVIRTLTQSAAKGNTRAMAMFLEHLKVIYEKQLSEQARLNQKRGKDLTTLFETMTDEQLIAFDNEMAKLLDANPPSPSPTRRAQPAKLTKSTDPDQSK